MALNLYELHQTALVMAYRDTCDRSRYENQSLADAYAKMIIETKHAGAVPAKT